MPVPFSTLMEVSVNLVIGTRPKNMTMLYMAKAGELVPETEILGLEKAQEFANLFADQIEANVILGMKNNFSMNVLLVDFSVKCPQQEDIYCIRPLGYFGVGSTAGGDHLGSRTFYTIRSNKGHVKINRKIHHITGVYENAQNDGQITPSVVVSVGTTWTNILTFSPLVELEQGTVVNSAAFEPVCVEHVKVAKVKPNGTPYLSYELPTTYNSFDYFTITNFSCKPTWKQFDK